MVRGLGILTLSQPRLRSELGASPLSVKAAALRAVAGQVRRLARAFGTARLAAADLGQSCHHEPREPLSGRRLVPRVLRELVSAQPARAAHRVDGSRATDLDSLPAGDRQGGVRPVAEELVEVAVRILRLAQGWRRLSWIATGSSPAHTAQRASRFGSELLKLHARSAAAAAQSSPSTVPSERSSLT